MNYPKCIAALTRPHSDYPGFINISLEGHGFVSIFIREDKDPTKTATLVITLDEFRQLVGEIVLSGVR